MTQSVWIVGVYKGTGSGLWIVAVERITDIRGR